MVTSGSFWLPSPCLLVGISVTFGGVVESILPRKILTWLAKHNLVATFLYKMMGSADLLPPFKKESKVANGHGLLKLKCYPKCFFSLSFKFYIKPAF